MLKVNATNQLSHVFVSSSPRSGHTLVQFMLTAHPEVSVSPETKTIARLLTRFSRRRTLNPQEVEQVVDLLKNDHKFNAWEIDTDALIKQISQLENPTVKQILDEMMFAYAQNISPGAHIIGNKKNFCEHAEMLKEIFPDAKFIFVIRDARATVSSMLEKLAHADLKEGILQWRRASHRARELQNKYPDDVLIVHYEKLVEKPEEEGKRMCDFLGIPFDATMLAHEKYSQNAYKDMGVAKEGNAHFQVCQPISASRIDAWKSELSASNLQTIEAMVGKELNHFGYKLLTKKSLHFFIKRLLSKPHIWLYDLLLEQKRIRCLKFPR